MMEIKAIYKALFKKYGPQGWWPLLDFKGINPTKTGSITGYHPGNYEPPNTEQQRFEICIGAILTQNVSWTNVEKSLINLKRLSAINPNAVLKLDNHKLKGTIRPSGYYNQKAKKLREFAEFYISLNGKIPSRNELLDVWGIGRETADSILLYAFKVPSFVVDGYTKRILLNLGMIDKKADYDDIQNLFEKNINPDAIVYQEYHALLVEHAKRHYYKGADYGRCLLYKKFRTNIYI